MSIRVGINGFGAIGKRFFRIAAASNQVEVVAVNDLADPKTLAHLLKYDSTYGLLNAKVEVKDGSIVVDGKPIKVFSQREPASIPWAECGVQVVVESTGKFTEAEKAAQHMKASTVKKVIISAPAKGEDITIVLGVNHDQYDPSKHHVISNASCTTNCLAPVAKVLHDNFKIVKALMTTCHAYTNDQVVLDFPHKDLRRARAAGLSIIPTTTGAARAVGKVLPDLNGKINGHALRVPVPAVSIVDLVAEVSRDVEADEVNQAFKKAASTYLDGILRVSTEPLVSVDFKGDSHSAIVDAPSTMVTGGRLVKVFAWYDNEWGYCNRLVDLVAFIGEKEGWA
ncbi:MAG TPA: type I glyceraldehyde-3-phosphate dehydrogenase [Firmicutes bacterium]|nr:type I glyceraldehyde-3-phosphate dehydrogenase [Bacillota bacterium]